MTVIRKLVTSRIATIIMVAMLIIGLALTAYGLYRIADPPATPHTYSPSCYGYLYNPPPTKGCLL